MLRVTQKDIAAKAGVSVMTVSKVLRDSGNIGQKTRDAVKAIAAELNYTPDPALTALVHHRNQKKHVKANSCLAFMTCFDTELGWKNELYVARYWEGARKRATQLGYTLENFWLKSPAMTPNRLAQIFENRNIQGLLVAPVLESWSEIEFDWERFCAVSLCRNLIWPKINVVDHNHPYSIKYAWHEMIKRGYSRVGYCIRKVSEEISDQQWLGGHLVQQAKWEQLNRSTSIEPLIEDDLNESCFNEWYKEQEPDVVVSPHIEVYRWMKEMRLEIPQEVGFLHLEARPNTGLSGIWQNFAHVGVTAVDLVHLEIMRLEMGMPSIRQSIAIDGTWIEGNTLRGIREGTEQI